MKNVVFFVVLAILTVGALVGWNAVRQRNATTEEVAQQPTLELTPTPQIGTAVGRGSDLGSLSNPTSTNSGGFGSSSKGGFIPVITSTPSATPKITRVINSTPKPTSNVTAMPQSANVVTYTDNGFNPKTLTVKSGTMVKFINQSSKRMWVESAETAGGKKLDTFNMGVTVGKDGFYEFQFTSTGTWGYFDHSNPSHNATVVVN
jgi:plastocyanin